MEIGWFTLFLVLVLHKYSIFQHTRVFGREADWADSAPSWGGPGTDLGASLGIQAEDTLLPPHQVHLDNCYVS